MKTIINVPREYESMVLEFGAKYDDKIKSFYVPGDVVISTFNPFIPLSVELIPSSNWGNNVRSEYKKEWDYIRKESYKSADYRCEICGEVGNTNKGENLVECHEMWSYDLENKIQKLEGLICLCPKCHRVKHWGLALVKKQEKIVKNHIATVNNWSKEDINKYINEAFYIFDIRSQVNWTLDLSFLKDYTQKDLK